MRSKKKKEIDTRTPDSRERSLFFKQRPITEGPTCYVDKHLHIPERQSDDSNVLFLSITS